MVPTLDELLPGPDHRTRQERLIAAPPAAVWRALHEMSIGDLRIGRALMAIRALPSRLAGRGAEAPRLGGPFIKRAPIPLVSSDAPHAMAFAGVSQPWRLRGGPVAPPLADAATFRAFTDPGWVKLALDFRLAPAGTGTRLSTETRVRATDDASRRRFGLYWLFVRAGSAVIRHEMLRAVDRMAVAS